MNGGKHLILEDNARGQNSGKHENENNIDSLLCVDVYVCVCEEMRKTCVLITWAFSISFVQMLLHTRTKREKK